MLGQLLVRQTEINGRFRVKMFRATSKNTRRGDVIVGTNREDGQTRRSVRKGSFSGYGRMSKDFLNARHRI